MLAKHAQTASMGSLPEVRHRDCASDSTQNNPTDASAWPACRCKRGHLCANQGAVCGGGAARVGSATRAKDHPHCWGRCRCCWPGCHRAHGLVLQSPRSQDACGTRPTLARLRLATDALTAPDQGAPWPGWRTSINSGWSNCMHMATRVEPAGCLITRLITTKSGLLVLIKIQSLEDHGESPWFPRKAGMAREGLTFGQLERPHSS